MAPLNPIFQGITPENPKPWSSRGYLESMTSNEEEIVRSLFQPIEVACEGGLPTENIVKYFGWESGNVEKRIATAPESDDTLLVFSSLLLPSAYGIYVILRSILLSGHVRICEKTETYLLTSAEMLDCNLARREEPVRSRVSIAVVRSRGSYGRAPAEALKR